MSFELDKDFGHVLQKLKEKIRQARLRTVIANNNSLLAVYWEIGDTINKQELAEGWGAKTVEKLAKDLRAEFPPILTGKYRFIKTHFDKLKHYFELTWESQPHYTTIRNHIKGIDTLELEAALRAITQHRFLPEAFTQSGYNHIAVDGKTLCGSSDPSEGSRAVQSFSFFNVARGLILGQIAISEKHK